MLAIRNRGRVAGFKRPLLPSFTTASPSMEPLLTKPVELTLPHAGADTHLTEDPFVAWKPSASG